MKTLIKVAMALPLLAVAIGVLMRFGFQKFVRFQVIGLKVTEDLNGGDMFAGSDLLSTMSLLCVGCTRGIGEGIAAQACKRGASVIVVGRSESKMLKQVCHEDKLSMISADLSSMKTCQRVVQELRSRSVDTVVFTVGIVNGPARRESAEGIELEAAVSFLSRFVMTKALLSGEALLSTPSRKARIFVMGFPGVPDTPNLQDFNWERSWQSWASHKNTVVANDALVLGVARNAKHSNVHIYGLNPGIIKTDLMFDFLGGEASMISQVQQVVIGLICPSVEDYSRSAVELLVTPRIEQLTGASFNQYGEHIASSTWLLADERNYELIWAEAEKLEQRALAHAS